MASTIFLASASRARASSRSSRCVARMELAQKRMRARERSRALSRAAFLAAKLSRMREEMSFRFFIFLTTDGTDFNGCLFDFVLGLLDALDRQGLIVRLSREKGACIPGGTRRS